MPGARCMLGRANVTVLMHRVILLERMGVERPSSKHFVDHANGHSLDNRRTAGGKTQLRWLTASENAANRHGIRVLPVDHAAQPSMTVPF
jgi:hypothetical protein